jgi:hypothetical protein
VFTHGSFVTIFLRKNEALFEMHGRYGCNSVLQLSPIGLV